MDPLYINAGDQLISPHYQAMHPLKLSEIAKA